MLLSAAACQPAATPDATDGQTTAVPSPGESDTPPAGEATQPDGNETAETAPPPDQPVDPASVKGEITLLAKNDLREKGDNAAMKEAVRAYIAAFNRVYPGVTVTVSYVDEMKRELDGAADVYLLTAEDSLRYVAAEKYADTKAASQLLDLSDYYTAFGVDTEALLTPAMELGDVAGAQMWVPFNYDRAVIYADRSVFAEAGVEIPSKDWDYAAFTQTVESLTFVTNTQRYTGLYLAYNQAFVWKLFARGMGGDYYNAEEKTVTLTEGKVYDGFKAMFSMLEAGTARGMGFNQKNSARSDSAMAIAFACQPERDGVYVESLDRIQANPAKNAEALMAEGNLVMLPLPAFPAGNVGVSNTAFCRGFGVDAGTKTPEAAAALALFALTAEGQQALISYFGGIPTSKTAIGMDFWRVGLLAGENAETVLVNIECDERDDFMELFENARSLYDGVLRTRTLFASILYRDYTEAEKRKPESYKPALAELETYINQTLRQLRA
jgi:ABC-type glycerol-3-phosphate transport system substrate-binding protein